MHENEKTRNRHAWRMAAIACAAAVTLIGACSSVSTGGVVSGGAAYREHPATPPASESGPLGELPASFEGDLPCADCEGIRYHLDLFEDGSFFYRLSLSRRRDGAVLDDIGSYRSTATGPP